MKKIILLIPLMLSAGSIFYLVTTNSSATNEKNTPTISESNEVNQIYAQRKSLEAAQVKPLKHMDQPSIDAVKNSNNVPREEIYDSQKHIDTVLNSHSSDVNDRIVSMQTMLQASPEDAAYVIYELLNKLDTDKMAQGIVSLGMLSLANHPSALSDDELDYIYHSYNNENVRARAARTLAHRGDERLLVEYVKKFEEPLKSNDIKAKNDKIMELANLQSKLAVPYISKYLSDDDEMVRLQALGALGMSATVEDIELIKPLLYDENRGVRELSRDVIDNLVNRGSEAPVPLDILLHPGENAASG